MKERERRTKKEKAHTQREERRMGGFVGDRAGEKKKKKKGKRSEREKEREIE